MPANCEPLKSAFEEIVTSMAAIRSCLDEIAKVSSPEKSHAIFEELANVFVGKPLADATMALATIIYSFDRHWKSDGFNYYPETLLTLAKELAETNDVLKKEDAAEETEETEE